MNTEDIKIKELTEQKKRYSKALAFLCKAVIEKENSRDVLRTYAKSILQKVNHI